MKIQVDLLSAFIPMILAICFTPSSSLTFVIWTISTITYDLDMATAKPEDLSRGISMVTNLPKNVKKGIFRRSLRTNQLSTLPRELFDLDSKYYSGVQKVKGDALVKQATQGIRSGAPGAPPHRSPDSLGTR